MQIKKIAQFLNEFYLSFTEPKIALPDRQSDVKGHSESNQRKAINI